VNVFAHVVKVGGLFWTPFILIAWIKKDIFPNMSVITNVMESQWFGTAIGLTLANDNRPSIPFESSLVVSELLLASPLKSN